MGALESNVLKRRGRSSGSEQLVAVVADASSEEVIRNVILDRAIANSHVARGTLDEAIDIMKKASESPRHLIVDVSGSAMPISDLMRLAEVVDPSVAVVVVGERNDVGLYRSLLQLGVQEYLVKPLTVELVRRAIDSTDPGASARTGKAISFVGARGGVGTTTIATALARHLAGTTRRRVAYVDLDPYGGAAASMLDVANTSGLMELMLNTQRLDQQLLHQALVAHDDRLFVLASELPYNSDFALRHGALTELVAMLKRHFHYILLDLPQRAGGLVEEAFDASAMIHVVADHSVHATREAARLCRFAEGRDSNPSIVVLLNEARQPVAGRVQAADFTSALGRGSVHPLPYEPQTLAIAESLGEALGDPNRSSFARAIVSLSNAITGSEPVATASSKRWYARLFAKRRAR
ncbi:pilus assembly protein CpaE [Trinickia symbiotica]|uniref:Fimbrial protein n=1 Tax=Trinickia symbiotica TaxID=863227 RepID=A0A2N7WTQ1_9BURK|nr:AAA family ATPase [Trinickia symbiotica]PMS32777.1 fimbrial protein [Trinickia symbiotica]PPK42125.1 pilus assembly protein CpaE [Trinickia symbiotica]